MLNVHQFGVHFLMLVALCSSSKWFDFFFSFPHACNLTLGDLSRISALLGYRIHIKTNSDFFLNNYIISSYLLWLFPPLPIEKADPSNFVECEGDLQSQRLGMHNLGQRI